ncbi:MAG: hypothetical protein JKY74_06245 [Shewanella sp.]|nr:hypothetical protein [Shewanella sp.]
MSLDEAKPKIIETIKRKKKAGVKCLWVSLHTDNTLRFETIDPDPVGKHVGNEYVTKYQEINITHPYPDKGPISIGEIELDNDKLDEKIAGEIIKKLKEVIEELKD